MFRLNDQSHETTSRLKAY